MKTDKREEIIRVALELIAEYGFHGTSMAMVADRAKVGAGTIYRYFESKDALIAALFTEVERSMNAALTENVDGKHTVQEQYVNFFFVVVKYLIDNPKHFRYIEQFFNSPYGVKHRRDKMLSAKGEDNIFVKLFSQGVEQGVMKDFPLFIFCALTFGPMTDIVRDHTLGFFILNDDMIFQIAQACWDGIKQ